VRLDGEGLPLPRLHPGGATEEGGWGVLMTGKATGRGYVVAGQMSRMGESGEQVRRQYLAAYDLEGNETATFVEQTGERDRSRPPRERDLVLPWALAWDVAPDGRVVVDEAWAAYRLNVYGADGALERVIEVDLPERERRDDDRRFMARLFGVPEGQPLPIELDEHEPAVAILQAGVQVSDAGEIWVLPSRGNRDLPPDVLARFDVFDAAGHFERQVEVICQGDPRNDRLVVLADGRMIRQRRFVDAFVTSLGPGSLPRDERADEGDSPAVICYRMVR
jgi:hypothetical protein